MCVCVRVQVSAKSVWVFASVRGHVCFYNRWSTSRSVFLVVLLTLCVRRVSHRGSQHSMCCPVWACSARGPAEYLLSSVCVQHTSRRGWPHLARSTGHSNPRTARVLVKDRGRLARDLCGFQPAAARGGCGVAPSAAGRSAWNQRMQRGLGRA